MPVHADRDVAHLGSRLEIAADLLHLEDRALPDRQGGRPHLSAPLADVLRDRPLLHRDPARGLLGPELQAEAGDVARELPALDRRGVARHEVELPGQRVRPARRVLPQEHDTDAQAAAGAGPHVAHERVGPVRRVGEIVLAEPLRQRQREVEHLAEDHGSLEQQAHPAGRGVLAERHLLPGAPVRLAALDPDGDLHRHASLPAPLRSSSALGHRLAGKLAQIG